ncbi:hypothetical protein [Natronomonas marina]|uniref:hypothetical protein n=1 Tax=Natronomonas marina TaxID=2961939 RepID=UPI0020C9BDF8|nr:hypothetical protein [Natronomonas marina]
MGYEIYLDRTQKGDEYGHDSPWVFVYDTDNVEDGYLSHAYNWVIDGFDIAYNDGYISGYTVEKRSIRNWTPDCRSDISVVAQWDEERNNNDLIHQGCHALIHTCSTDYVALGTNSGDNIWKTDNSAVATTDEGNRDLDGVADTVLHEFGHCASRSNLCSNVDNMTEQSEHDLGIVTQDGWTGDMETPLSVGGDDASRGTCDTKSGWKDGETYQHSDCEKSAFERSAEHTAGYH